MELMPEQGTRPVNRYLPPRPRDAEPEFDVLAPYLEPVAEEPRGFLGWLDRTLGYLATGSKEAARGMSKHLRDEVRHPHEPLAIEQLPALQEIVARDVAAMAAPVLVNSSWM